MESGRYHRAVGFPEGAEETLVRFLSGFNSVRYSTHAKYETIRDSRGVIPVVKKFELRAEQCFELVAVGELIVKAAFQVPGESYNYTYVVSSEGLVLTVWANAKDDTHQTLDKTQYAQVQ
jgi:hypothetical protein